MTEKLRGPTIIKREPSVFAHDFDGAITDVWGISDQYADVYSHYLAKELVLPSHIVAEGLHVQKEIINANPGIYGWEVNGFIVAPANADPYLLSTVAAQQFLFTLKDLYPKVAFDPEAANNAYRRAYKEVQPGFKYGAADYIKELQANGTLCFVTNAETEKVESLLEKLLGQNNIKVHGNAKKYLINPDWQRLPFQMQPEGFPTPVLLRRENYVNILEGVGADHTFGDIFSLDLSAPNQLGIFTVLLSSPQTPDYELQYYQNNENGFSAASFEDVLANLPKR